MFTSAGSEKSTAASIHIYLITHHTSRKLYVSQSLRPQQRFAQHMLQPNKRMRADVLAASPTPANAFTWEILASTTSKSHADVLEANFIAQHNTIGSSGYNLLRRSGRASSQFRYLHDTGRI